MVLKKIRVTTCNKEKHLLCLHYQSSEKQTALIRTGTSTTLLVLVFPCTIIAILNLQDE